jgi:hypothetical protein
MLQLQETENRQSPGATTWAAKFLIREIESREFLGLWFASGAIHEHSEAKKKKKRATQVITCSFPCEKWLHMIKARKSPSCELCQRERREGMSFVRERRQGQAAMQSLPEETVAHIQSAGCKAQTKSVIGAHDGCWKYPLCAITKYDKAESNFEFIGEDKDKQLASLSKDSGIGDILPWEDIANEAERLLEMSKASRDATKEDNGDGEQEHDQEVERDETDPYNEVIFGRRRPDSVVVDWANKVLLFWNSSVHRIKDGITQNGGNLEHEPNMISPQESRESGKRRRG